MRMIRQAVSLDHHFSVATTRGLFAPEHTLVRSLLAADGVTQGLVVADKQAVGARVGCLEEIVAYFEGHGLKLLAPVLLVPGGDRAKRDPRWLETLYLGLEEGGLDQHAFVMAVGGGALLDLVGFAVATARARPRLIRVPTTAAAQCEWGMGLTSRLHHLGRPDFLAAFAPPYAVLNDVTFWASLSPEGVGAGLAAAIRLALTRDAGFFEWIEDRAEELLARDPELLEALVHRAVELIAQRQAQEGDPLDAGNPSILDFGEWLMAHLLLPPESGIAIGTALLASYGYMLGALDDEAFQRVLELLARLGLPTYLPRLAGLLAAPADKWVSGSRLWVLSAIGQAVPVRALDDLKLKGAIALLERHHRMRHTPLDVVG